MVISLQGTNIGIEAYSAFEATHFSSALDMPTSTSTTGISTGNDSLLAKYLEDNAVDRVVVVGLATDYVSIMLG